MLRFSWKQKDSQTNLKGCRQGRFAGTGAHTPPPACTFASTTRTVQSDAAQQFVPERAHAMQSLTELLSGSLWVALNLPWRYHLVWLYLLAWEKNLSQSRSAPWTATSSLPGPRRKLQQSPFPQTPAERTIPRHHQVPAKGFPIRVS